MSDPINLPENLAIAPTGHNLPPKAIERACTECGTLFDVPATGPGQHKRFCCDKHRKAWNNRNNAEGGPLMPLLRAWCVARNAKGQSAEATEIREVGAKAFSEICSILDLMIAQDRAEGRTSESMIDYQRAQFRSGYGYLERTRRC